MKTVNVSVNVSSNQVFALTEEKPDHEQIVHDFSSIKCILDPAPPCKWKVIDLKVDNLEVGDNEVRRNFSCVIQIQARGHKIQKLKRFMAEQGYFDKEEHTFYWEQGINYFIAETTLCEDYAIFNKEDITLDIMDLSSKQKTKSDHVDIDGVISAAFSEVPVVQMDGSLLLPAHNAKEQAKRLFIGIKDCTKAPTHNPGCGRLTNELVGVLKISEKWKTALPVLENARQQYLAKLDSNQDIEYILTLADILNALATAQEQTDDIQAAINNYRHALQLSEEIDGFSADTINLINNLANALETEGLDSEAIKLYETALLKSKQLQPTDPQLIARINSNMGFLQKRNGNFDAARAHYAAAIELLSNSNEDDFEKAICIFNAARLEADSGNGVVARILLTDARSLIDGYLEEDHELFAAIDENLNILDRDS